MIVDHDVHEVLEGRALGRVQRRQHRVLHFERDRVEPAQRVPTGGRQPERVPAAVVGVAPAGDEPRAFEDVDDGDDEIGRASCRERVSVFV